MRPTDSVLLLLPILSIALLVRRLRRYDVLAALAVGGLLGWAPWVVEAFVRFGGPLARLRAGNEAGLGGVAPSLVNLLTYPRMLDGLPNYCCCGGPAAQAGPVPTLLTVWFVAIPLLALLRLFAAARRQRVAELALAGAPACLFAAFYFLLLRFASVRFLLPIGALLSLPVAAGLVDLVAMTRGRLRLATGVLVGLVLVGHLGLMLPTAAKVFPMQSRSRAREPRVAAALRPLVAKHPCMLVAVEPVTRSYYLGCSAQLLKPTPRQPSHVAAARRRGWSVLAVLPKAPPPGTCLASWQRVPLPQLGRGWAAHLAPGSPGSAWHARQSKPAEPEPMTGR